MIFCWTFCKDQSVMSLRARGYPGVTPIECSQPWCNQRVILFFCFLFYSVSFDVLENIWMKLLYNIFHPDTSTLAHTRHYETQDTGTTQDTTRHNTLRDTRHYETQDTTRHKTRHKTQDTTRHKTRHKTQHTSQDTRHVTRHGYDTRHYETRHKTLRDTSQDATRHVTRRGYCRIVFCILG